MNRELIKKIFTRVLVLAAIILGVLLIIRTNFKERFLGYIFGMSVSMLNFLLIKSSVEKSVRMNPGAARRYAMGQYFLRMTIYGIVLVIGAIAHYLNFFMVFLGLMMVKIVIVLSAIFDKEF